MLWPNFLLAIARIIHLSVTLYMWIVIIRAVLSWIQMPALYQLNVILYKLTEPLLKPIRKYVPPYKTGGLDVSPMILIIALLFVDSFLIKSLTQYALSLRQASPWNL
jgi:YggT family protein